MLNNKKNFPISTFELKRIQKELYRPDNPKKYFSENGIECINSAEPSDLMMLTGEPEKEPKVILDFLFNLFNSNYENMEYFINWIAFNFAFGKKPVVAVGLFGLEGTGKGILYLIMEMLYGEKNCNQINAASFKSNYDLAKEIQNIRFLNLDEITYSVSNKHESLIKALITNKSILLGKVIELHAQCLFTANYANVFKISDNDRRYSIFQSGHTLESTNFLGFRNYDNLLEKIKDELPDFAKYLKSLDINQKLANTAIDTPEKKAIILQSKNFVIDFHNAIVNLNIDFFDKLKYQRNGLYHRIRSNCISNRRFNRADLTDAFYCLYGEQISTVDLMNQLRTINKDGIFDLKNTQYHGHSNSIHYIYPKGKN